MGEECYKFDSCRARYPFDGPSGGSASFATAGNYDGVIDWNATAVMAPRDMDNTAYVRMLYSFTRIKSTGMAGKHRTGMFT